MKKLPDGWPRISPSIYYQDAPKALAFLQEAFGFELRMKVDGKPGEIMHSELTFGEGLIMVGSERDGGASPRSVGGANTMRLFVYVDDVDAHAARARAAGATIVKEPEDVDYGEDHWKDRGYQALDPEGNQWYFAQRLRG